jgi:hypothetical protein
VVAAEDVEETAATIQVVATEETTAAVQVGAATERTATIVQRTQPMAARNRHHYLNSSEKRGLKFKQWMT